MAPFGATSQRARRAKKLARQSEDTTQGTVSSLKARIHGFGRRVKQAIASVVG